VKLKSKISTFIFILFLYFFILILIYFNIEKQFEIDISECISNGNLLFPKNINSIKIIKENNFVHLYATGEGKCFRNITSAKNITIIVISEILNITYFSFLGNIECKNKILIPINIKVDCCSDEDCPVGYVCYFHKCTPKNKTIYVYVYPTFYVKDDIPKCIGEDGNILYGIDVGEVCYTQEILEFRNINNTCVWVDGIKYLEIYGNITASITLYDYYNNLVNNINIIVNNNKTFIINDDTIRRLCMIYFGNLEKITVLTYRYKIYFKHD